ncbi:MAG: S46 family peptidase [Acidobacteria bacterium]|nr:S46 family peptidase [Acidobacteriota bacterium]
MKRAVFISLVAVILAVTVTGLVGDEGMWTFDNPPRKLIKEKYGFDITDQWLEHIRLSAVRVSGASASFVSPDGLLLTNQHVGRDQVAKLSTPQRDLIKDGFYAATREGELTCTDFEANVLVSYEEVTKRVQGAVKAGATDKDANAQRKAEMATVEKECSVQTGLKCEVITLYSGGEYWLYRNKKYTDIRLVFAPEQDIAYFGGDYDNFTYPRWNFDITLFRVYENGQPLKSEHFLKWSKNGAAEGELIFAPGYPGATARLLTVGQLKYQRDLGNPLQMQVWTSRRDALVRYQALGAEQARRGSTPRLGLENSIKRLIGQQDGLKNPRIFKKKEGDESALRAKVAATVEWQKLYAPAWDQIAMAYAALPAYAKRIAFSNLTASRLAGMASTIVRYADEIPKASTQRYPEFTDARLEGLKFSLFSSAPIYLDMEEAQLTAWLDEGLKTLGPADSFVKAALGGQSPAALAKQVLAGTKLTDVAARKALIEGGPAAIKASTDPLIDLARRVEPIIRGLRAWQEEKIQSVESSAGEKIARARFAAYGKTVYPDANSNLRFEFGTVLGYELGSTLVPYRTTFFGLYERAAAFNEKAPFTLPARWREGRTKLDLATPFNFVYTADTIGGNSGTPIINRNAEVVGVNFDSNIQKLPNRYMYIDDAEGSRAIGVHSAGIIEGLKKLYGADRLVAELTGGAR